ncbi:transmembrane protein [Ceratobasidium sp. AG-Ba]|nr:transmembrane protein [Ceratobasidium sp. AG-Ba]
MSSISCPNNNNSTDFCTQITANPDISGIGVRVAIYAQTFISMLVASWLPYHEKAFRDTSRNSYVVSGSLIIASIIAWKSGELSLFDGLIVTMLTTIMTAFVTVNGPYIRTLGLSINISSLLFTTFWCYWGLQIWADPWNFGIVQGENQGPCDVNQETLFVVFGHSVGATSRGLRGFAIFIFGIGAISAISAFWRTIVWSLKYTFGKAQVAKDNAAVRYAKEIRRKNRGTRSTGNAQHITRYGGMVGAIYMIVTTEQIVKRNPGVKDDLDKWTYGQTIALIMLGQQIMDCFSYFKEYIIERHRELERERRRNATA